MKSTLWLLAGMLVLGTGGRLAAQRANAPITNPIDVANEVERLQAENASLEDQLAPQAELALLRQQNAELKNRLSGPQSLADLKAATLQRLDRPSASNQNRRGPTTDSFSALLRACADPDDPRHVQSLKNLYGAGESLTLLLDDVTNKLAVLPPSKNADESTARLSLATRLAAVRKVLAEVAADPRAAREEWRYPIRDLLDALQ